MVCGGVDDGGDRDGETFSLLGRPIPAWAVLRVVVVEPGAREPYVEDDWRNALVVVERGEITIEAWCGRLISFAGGSVLWLVGLAVRALLNTGDEPAVLTALARRVER